MNLREQQMKYISKMIKDARENVGISQKNLGEAIKSSQTTSQRIESMKVLPELTTLSKIAKVLNLGFVLPKFVKR